MDFSSVTYKQEPNFVVTVTADALGPSGDRP